MQGSVMFLYLKTRLNGFNISPTFVQQIKVERVLVKCWKQKLNAEFKRFQRHLTFWEQRKCWIDVE